jgi:putative toxin-antitoxin system antitoxin component (TIGR02293 family)
MGEWRGDWALERDKRRGRDRRPGSGEDKAPPPADSRDAGDPAFPLDEDGKPAPAFQEAARSFDFEARRAGDADFDALLDHAAATAGREGDAIPEFAVLGGGGGIGHGAGDEDGLARAVQEGFLPAAVDALAEAGFQRAEIEAFVIPWRTLSRRRGEGRLSPQESDAAYRLARILCRAEATLGGRERALAWLRSPKRRFAGRPPMDLLATEAGARRIETVLLRADLGLSA